MSVYRWWSVGAWREDSFAGVKIGPVSFVRYTSPHFSRDGQRHTYHAMTVCGRWRIFDTGVRACLMEKH